MLKIKVFDCGDEKDLEKEMNDFIESIEEKGFEIKEIQYSTCNGTGLTSFSALVMYDNKI